MLFSAGSLLTGVGASAAQNAPVTKTCLQCGAVLPSSVRACNFCDSSFSSSPSCYEDYSASPPSATPRHNAAAENPCFSSGDIVESAADREEHASPWRGEVSMRMEAYRARKRKRPASENQTHLPFERDETPSARAVTLDEAPAQAADDFSFTIAIGRTAQSREKS